MGKLFDGAAIMGQSDGRKASRIKNPRDFWSVLMFLVIGASFAIGSTAYRFGYSAKPGPGYFPFGLGILLALLGVLILVKSLGKTSGKGEAVGAFAWRPLLMLAAAVVFFGVSLKCLGLLITMPLLVILSSLAGKEFRWGEVILNATIITLGSWAIFIWGLELQMPIKPWFMLP